MTDHVSSSFMASWHKSPYECMTFIINVPWKFICTDVPMRSNYWPNRTLHWSRVLATSIHQNLLHHIARTIWQHLQLYNNTLAAIYGHCLFTVVSYCCVRWTCDSDSLCRLASLSVKGSWLILTVPDIILPLYRKARKRTRPKLPRYRKLYWYCTAWPFVFKPC